MSRAATPTPRLDTVRESELDLQIELADLLEEIESRVERMSVVLALLRETRRELLVLTGIPPRA